MEGLKDARQVLLSDAWPLVGDLANDLIVLKPQDTGDLPGLAAIFEGVVQQVGQGAREQGPVAMDQQVVGRGLKPEGHARPLRPGPEIVRRFGDEIGEVEHLPFQGARLSTGEVNEVVGQGEGSASIAGYALHDRCRRALSRGGVEDGQDRGLWRTHVVAQQLEQAFALGRSGSDRGDVGQSEDPGRRRASLRLMADAGDVEDGAGGADHLPEPL